MNSFKSLILCIAGLLLLSSMLFAQFIGIATSFTGLHNSSVAWGDYDNDGDLDFLLTGFSPSSSFISRIYRNNGNGTVTDIDPGLTGVGDSSTA